MICKGRKGRYQLSTTPLGNGGEGAVYEISNCKGSVAKLYHPQKLQSSGVQLEKKLKTMISHVQINPVVDGFLKVAWPQDILYDDNNRFVGFVMPKVDSGLKIYQIEQDEKHRLKLFPNYTWKYAVQYAYNLSWVVCYLHLNGVVIGDLNMNNIVVDRQGHVTLIDCDSFDIKNLQTGERFKCEVGMEELLAPEIQGAVVVANADFTAASDDFSLAIHIFRLLMMNADPFCAALVGKSVDSTTAFNTNRNIMNGESPFFRNIAGRKIPPWAPPLNMLPPEIVTAFKNTFSYRQITIRQSISKRTTAEQWNQILLKYAMPEPNPNLKTCRKHHVFAAHQNLCPFCKMFSS